MKLDAFDRLFLKIVNGHKLTKGLGTYYTKTDWFRKFIKYVSTVFVTFWLVKGPLIWLFTDVIGWWYVVSAFVVGIIVTVIGFVTNHFLGVIEWERR